MQTILFEFIINNHQSTHIYADSGELPLTPPPLVLSRNLNHARLSESSVNVETDIYQHCENLTSIIINLSGTVGVQICDESVSTVDLNSLKVVSATFVLVCFLSLNESTFQTRKNVFYFTSKALFVLDKIKF